MAVNQDIILAGNAFREMNIYDHPASGLIPSGADDLPVKLGYFRIADNASFQAVMNMKGAPLVSGTVIPLRLEPRAGSGEFCPQGAASFVEYLEILEGDIVRISFAAHAQRKPPRSPGKAALEIICSVFIYGKGTVLMDVYFNPDFREIEILRGCHSACD